MEKPTNAFESFEWNAGKIADLDRVFPSYLSCWDGAKPLEVGEENATHFGYVDRGSAILYSYSRSMSFRLDKGMYFAHPGKFSIEQGRGIVVSREDYNGFFHIGGPIENAGRLKYIDGCTDSLLIPPIQFGDPCLNLLYFPPDIDQTAHTHPSDRIGIVMSGLGKCVFNDDDEEVDLEAGMIFAIRTNGKHKFQTPYGKEMRVLAFHPDSDFGPQDEAHPMLNRTIIDGVSAADPARSEFRTE